MRMWLGVGCREEECSRWLWAPLVLPYSSGLVNIENSTAICLKVFNLTFHKAVKKCWGIMALGSPQAMADGSCYMSAQLPPPITEQIYAISLGPHWVKLQVSTVCLITCFLLAILPSLSYFLPPVDVSLYPQATTHIPYLRVSFWESLD